ncbi:MAG: dienelactone hydrolase family protein [Planctomycetota bacterium]
MHRTLSLAPIALVLASCASHEDSSSSDVADIRTEEVSYTANGTDLKGYFAIPANAGGDVPGVLIVHEWWGHNDYVRSRAEQLARLGYAAFALDMYGADKSATHPDDATAFMNEVMGNYDRMEARFNAAVEVLNAQTGVDERRTAAIGYCMGGAIVLRMARGGADLDAVASFHGAIGASAPETAAPIRAQLLVCNGADDPFVTQEQITEFKTALSDVEMEFINYPGVVHGFTNPGATGKGEEFGLPLRYDAEADADSWRRMRELFEHAL